MTTIKLRRGTASEWASANPILAEGEPGYEKDTGKHKLGDGFSNWTDLPYFLPEDLLDLGTAATHDVGTAPGEIPLLGAGGKMPAALLPPVLPTGGTSGQALLKNSATDGDAGWTTLPPALPTGGTTGQALIKNSATNGDAGWKNILQLFRGEWAPDTVAYSQGFSSAALPSGFAGSHTGAGSDPAPNVTVSSSGVTGAPAGWTSAVRLASNTTGSSDSSTLTLDLAALNLTGITRVKYWYGRNQGSQYDSTFGQVLKNATIVVDKNMNVAWEQQQVTCTEADDISFKALGKSGLGSNSTTYTFITGVEVYVTADPYKAGQFVTYNGALYKSASDNNAATPGADSSWVQIPVGPMHRGTFTATPTRPYILGDTIIDANGIEWYCKTAGTTAVPGSAGAGLTDWGVAAQPVILINTGAAIPANLPANTIILEKG